MEHILDESIELYIWYLPLYALYVCRTEKESVLQREREIGFYVEYDIS